MPKDGNRGSGKMHELGREEDEVDVCVTHRMTGALLFGQFPTETRSTYCTQCGLEATHRTVWGLGWTYLCTSCYDMYRTHIKQDLGVGDGFKQRAEPPTRRVFLKPNPAGGKRGIIDHYTGEMIGLEV